MPIKPLDSLLGLINLTKNRAANKITTAKNPVLPTVKSKKNNNIKIIFLGFFKIILTPIMDEIYIEKKDGSGKIKFILTSLNRLPT
jgi:hypothetical protein